MPDISYFDEEKNEGRIRIDKYPDECPVCKKGNEFKPLISFYKNERYGFDTRLQVVFRCPRHECQTLFFAFYNNTFDRVPDNLFFNRFGFIESTESKDFPDPIPTISPRFLRVHYQAEMSETNGLDEVCGLAFGKALEILIKDYLISLDKTQEEEIKKEVKLAKLMDRLNDTDLQIVADRATWLRNDEAHYLRKWENQDISDLKILIELTIQHIRRIELTKQYKEKMPDPSKKT